MAKRAEIIDIEVDPLAERARRRRTLLRIGLPLVGVGLIVGILLGIEVYTDAANRAGVLSLSQTLLNGLQQRIALQVSIYLLPAERAILLARNQFGRGGATRRADEARAFAASELEHTPQVANVLFADAEGNFQLVTRAGDAAPGGTTAERILVGSNWRSVDWITWDRTGAIIARRSDPLDTFDARTRPWFIGARATNEVFWTPVYIFFTERSPGVTAAVRGQDENPDVVGIDIRLDEVSRFLASLSIGRTGRAYIVDRTGTLIAGPDPKRIMRRSNGELAPANIAEIDDPDLAAGWDHYRIEGPGSRVIEVAGQHLISIATPLSAADAQWLLMITVPEAEFSGFITINSRRSAEWSLSVLLLALSLAVLLVRQGLRADRADRAVAARAAALRGQAAAMARMSVEASRLDAPGNPPTGLTEAVAEATSARRASAWRLLPAGHGLRCEDSYEPLSRVHVAGFEIAEQEVPQLLAALEQGEEIDTADARRDRRTAPLLAALSGPAGTVRMLVVPLLRESRVRGAVLLEDARTDVPSRDLVRAWAALLALHSSGQTSVEDTVPAAPLRPRLEVAMEAGWLAATLLGTDEPAPAGGKAMRAAALVIRLRDKVLSHPDATAGADGSPVVRLARAVEEVAAAHGVPYARMLGGTVVAAAGLAEQSDGALADAALRLADVALALRQLCLTLFAQEESTPDFGFGLDVGPVQAERLGDHPATLNLWGVAFRNAEILADSAPAGAIQASEQAHRRLRQHFVFRSRGVFHRPGLGDSGCYLLSGRA